MNGLVGLTDASYDGADLAYRMVVKQRHTSEPDINTRTRNGLHRSVRCCGDCGIALRYAAVATAGSPYSKLLTNPVAYHRQPGEIVGITRARPRPDPFRARLP